jgi:hypothetical protein
MICAFNGARELVEDRSESGHSGPEPPGAYSDSDIDLEHASSPEHPVGRVRSSLSGICSLTAAMNAASGLNFSRLPCKISARGRAKASLHSIRGVANEAGSLPVEEQKTAPGGCQCEHTSDTTVATAA